MQPANMVTFHCINGDLEIEIDLLNFWHWDNQANVNLPVLTRSLDLYAQFLRGSMQRTLQDRTEASWPTSFFTSIRDDIDGDGLDTLQQMFQVAIIFGIDGHPHMIQFYL